MKKSFAKIISATITILVFCWFAIGWVFLGVSPLMHLAWLIYPNVPRFEVQVDLKENVPIVLQARILEKRRYLLNLRVYFSGNEERAVVAALVGGPVGRPGNIALPPGTQRTSFHVSILSADGRIVHERDVQSEGRSDTSSDSLGRRIDEFVLGKGAYEISLTPTNSSIGLHAFRTSLELTYQPKSSAID